MELLSNLVWLLVSALTIGTMWRAFHRGHTRLSLRAALLSACLISAILLPKISVSDDLLEAHQKTLPAAMQTWRLASDGASVGLDLIPLLCFGLLLAVEFIDAPQLFVELVFARRRQSLWVTRAGRLRPPPFKAA